MALKPPYRLLSLPFFCVLYRKTYSPPQSENTGNAGKGEILEIFKIIFLTLFPHNLLQENILLS